MKLSSRTSCCRFWRCRWEQPIPCTASQCCVRRYPLSDVKEYTAFREFALLPSSCRCLSLCELLVTLGVFHVVTLRVQLCRHEAATNDTLQMQVVKPYWSWRQFHTQEITPGGDNDNSRERRELSDCSMKQNSCWEADSTLRWSRHSPHLVEKQSSLSCSQQVATFPYLEPDESNLYS
jgi:hypothetical protein